MRKGPRFHRPSYERARAERVKQRAAHDSRYRGERLLILRRYNWLAAIFGRPQVKHQLKGRRLSTVLGYTIRELADHLEQLFEPGMSWNNTDLWHVHHRRSVEECGPFSSIDDPKLIACMSPDNLRPAWAEENMRQGARSDSEIAQVDPERPVQISMFPAPVAHIPRAKPDPLLEPDAWHEWAEAELERLLGPEEPHDVQD